MEKLRFLQAIYLQCTIRSYWGGTLSNRNSGDFAENSGGGKDIKKKLWPLRYPQILNSIGHIAVKDFDQVDFGHFWFVRIGGKA